MAAPMLRKGAVLRLCLERNHGLSGRSSVFYKFMRRCTTQASNSDTVEPSEHEISSNGLNDVPSPGLDLRRFTDLQDQRRQEALRSVLVRHVGKATEEELTKFCSHFGEVQNSFTYGDKEQYTLLEYTSKGSVHSLLNTAHFRSVLEVVPYRSRLLSFRTSNWMNSSSKKHSVGEMTAEQRFSILATKLCAAQSMEEQMRVLVRETELSEGETRLRFLVCSLVEDAITGHFPGCIVHPFGSSVNGFGNKGCDLDMYLNLNVEEHKPKKKKSFPRMEYEVKTVPTERAATQNLLSTVGQGLAEFVPSCRHVQYILNARCPLVKFMHEATGIQCDLTSNNSIALKSSELLNLYSRIDPRVAPLVYAVRHWARLHHVTSNMPGGWITNFSLTALVIFFLQYTDKPVVPRIDALKELADKTDTCILEGNDCTLVSDLTKVPLSENTDSIDDLLLEFFEFYSNFNFRNCGLNLRTGEIQEKQNFDALYIQNPFEQQLNLSKNVSMHQLEKFVQLAREAAWMAEQPDFLQPEVGPKGGVTPWGLVSILSGYNKRKRRLMDQKEFTPILDSIKSGNSTRNSSHGNVGPRINITEPVRFKSVLKSAKSRVNKRTKNGNKR
ncbi:PREDICTED: poly(A) RNA polymerase, mitochondrial-like [Branchiostoma belcheri]|uniref:Poly(A) RNA polymerase, mitochondrial-like n=1 Tax=Branchiostoma belcheri TaxID=7741 RepID=A0A6P4Z104_BRABE|nr:PREDICTED: poly(A) RNA polymerase, mitochondrial-like [Branchiostoma belcheri]